MKKQKKMILGVCVCAVFAAVLIFMPAVLQAGSLEPYDPPGSTMKTLNDIPPTWSQKIAGHDRFYNTFLGVMDKETGLVWERSPSQTRFTWLMALQHCYKLEKGGRKGWHLPTVEQLASLVDTSVSGKPKLPSGHPFDTDCTSGGCVQAYDYFSATTPASAPAGAWYTSFGTGGVSYGLKSSQGYAWCVRGGQSYDAY